MAAIELDGVSHAVADGTTIMAGYSDDTKNVIDLIERTCEVIDIL